VLKDVPQFLLNNPIALQKKYIEFKDGPNMKKRRADWRNAVTDAEENALEILEGLFDWLDGLQPHPTTGVSQIIQAKKSVAFTFGCTWRTDHFLFGDRT